MTEITPEKVARTVSMAMDSGWRHRLQASLSVTAEGPVLNLSVTRWEDDEEGTEIVRHFRAPVVEGETVPIVLPTGAKPAYVNGDDGYKWLTCEGCEEPLIEVDAGTSLRELNEQHAAHRCPAEAAQAEQERAQ